MTLPLLLALLAQTVAPPRVSPAPSLIDPATTPPLDEGEVYVGDVLGEATPQTEMVDFLGRRMRCANAAVNSGDEEEEARLRCTALPEEELGWRARFAGNAGALRWLDQNPRSFRMPRLFVATFDGPSPARALRAEQSGVDEEGRRYRLTIDTEAENGRSTRITASYDGWPERSFTLSNRLFPLIDLQSLEVAIGEPPPSRSLEVELAYGHDRTYCGTEIDNRQKVIVFFESARVRAQEVRRTNCEFDYVRIEENAAP